MISILLESKDDRGKSATEFESGIWREKGMRRRRAGDRDNTEW